MAEEITKEPIAMSNATKEDAKESENPVVRSTEEASLKDPISVSRDGDPVENSNEPNGIAVVSESRKQEQETESEVPVVSDQNDKDCKSGLPVSLPIAPEASGDDGKEVFESLMEIVSSNCKESQKTSASGACDEPNEGEIEVLDSGVERANLTGKCETEEAKEMEGHPSQSRLSAAVTDLSDLEEQLSSILRKNSSGTEIEVFNFDTPQDGTSETNDWEPTASDANASQDAIADTESKASQGDGAGEVFNAEAVETVPVNGNSNTKPKKKSSVSIDQFPDGVAPKESSVEKTLANKHIDENGEVKSGQEISEESGASVYASPCNGSGFDEREGSIEKLYSLSESSSENIKVNVSSDDDKGGSEEPQQHQLADDDKEDRLDTSDAENKQVEEDKIDEKERENVVEQVGSKGQNEAMTLENALSENKENLNQGTSGLAVVVDQEQSNGELIKEKAENDSTSDNTKEDESPSETSQAVPPVPDIEIVTSDENGILVTDESSGVDSKSLDSLDVLDDRHSDMSDVDSDSKSDFGDDDSAFGDNDEAVKNKFLDIERDRFGSDSSTVSEREFKQSAPVDGNTAMAILSGHLLKLGGTGLTPRNWRKRWFVLKEDNNLYYYKHSKDTSPCGVIVLQNYSVSKAPESNKKHCFKLNKGGARCYHFSAASEADMKAWMVALMQAASTVSKPGAGFQLLEGNVHNVSIPALSIRHPDCHGYLSKQGHKVKSWKRRYCVLKNGYLYYYSDMANNTALGVAKLLGFTLEKGENKGKHFCYHANAPEAGMRSYCFAAETDADRERWMSKMEESIRRGAHD
ncbi:FK506-binding protein 5 isoform X1 [Nematostella vectensis]|uniref:FK506-binding protein 5 isoform X1 n=1 Tax=Nematostella vectensis TaxID=45351 RepID=UPI00138FF477|nr:FK506-binding protein 5 isoform X1 [Nematostella vectensis]XP_032219052.1 FK506-binding protein 5 isoform X1 [Nematostella vectensis]